MPKRRLLSSLTHNELVKLKVEALVLERMMGGDYIVDVGLCLHEIDYEDMFFMQILKRDKESRVKTLVDFEQGLTYEELKRKITERIDGENNVRQD